MIISHKHKFIFIKTKKTAGSSIQIALSRHCGKEDIITPMGQLKDTDYSPRNFKKKDNGLGYFGTHCNAPHIKKLLTPTQWSNYTIISCERNPWDKTVSMYLYLKKYHNLKEPFEKWCLEYNKKDKEKWLPKCWHYYTIDGKIIVDKFIMYENLEADYNHTCEILGITPLPLGKEKIVRKNKKYDTFYNAVTRDIVSTHFSKEIKLFNYKY